MIIASRRLRVCAALVVAAVATSAARNQPPRPDARVSSAPVLSVRTLSVSITPNGAVPSHTQCTWTATVSGGVAPYHYAWTVNNVAAGTDSQFLQYTNNGNPFRVFVTVTDANSAQAIDSNVMSVGG